MAESVNDSKTAYYYSYLHPHIFICFTQNRTDGAALRGLFSFAVESLALRWQMHDATAMTNREQVFARASVCTLEHWDERVLTRASIDTSEY
jgi:hypothetical protein